MYLNGYITIMVRAISGRQVQFVDFIFIDDTNLSTAGCLLQDQQSYESTQSIAQHAQDGAHTWQGALDASGGALEPSKCSWALVDFIFVNGKW
jgi:hypothetical protein